MQLLLIVIGQIGHFSWRDYSSSVKFLQYPLTSCPIIVPKDIKKSSTIVPIENKLGLTKREMSGIEEFCF